MTFSENSRVLVSTFVLVLACGDDGSTTTGGADDGSSTSGTGTSTTAGTLSSTSAGTTGTSTGESSGGGSGDASVDGSGGSSGETGATGATGSTGGSDGTSSATSDGSTGGSSGDTGTSACCDPGDQPICIEGSTCCVDGTWECNEGNGQPACEEGTVCGQPICCDPGAMPICFEGVSCCDDGQWLCNDEGGMPTCAGGLGVECEGNMCGGAQASCADPNDPPCCQGLECCSGIPIPPGQEYCAQVCPISDRNKKRNFATVDATSVLRKVVDMPITTWSYTFEDATVRHIGPMAQDFQAAFEVGASDKAIFQVDADGVALASIQALAAELATVKDENERLKATLAAMERRLARLEGGK